MPTQGGTSSLQPTQGNVQDWLRTRARLAPNLLPQAPPWVRGVFDHAWAPMQALARQVAHLPGGLWGFLLCHEGGWVVVQGGASRYQTGTVDALGRWRRNVVTIGVEDLARDNDLPLHVVGHLVDHYLGCAGDEAGPWLSGGGGLVPRWQEAGARLGRLFALGYAVDEVAAGHVRDYFAQSLAWHCRRPRELNVADPQIWKWFRTTLWDDSFWTAEEGSA